MTRSSECVFCPNTGCGTRNVRGSVFAPVMPTEEELRAAAAAHIPAPTETTPNHTTVIVSEERMIEITVEE